MLARYVLSTTPMPEKINKRSHDHVLLMMNNGTVKTKKKKGEA